MNKLKSFRKGKLLFSFFSLALLFFISCERGLLEQKTNSVTPTVNQKSSQSGDCINFRDFNFEKGQLICHRNVEGTDYFEYTLRPTETAPVFSKDDIVNIEFQYNHIVSYDSEGSRRDILKVSSGDSNLIGDNFGTLTMNNTPEDFTGEIYYFDMSTDAFIEGKSYQNGSLSKVFHSVSSNSCNSLNNETLASVNDDCITVYYSVPRIVEDTKIVDWYNTSGDLFEWIGTSISYESFPAVFLEEFIFCPDGVTENVPQGDDGPLGIPGYSEHVSCINFLVQLLEDGFRDPCDPSVPGILVFRDLWENGLVGCSDIQTLADSLSGSYEAEISGNDVFDLLTSDTPNEILCSYLQGEILPISCQSFNFEDVANFQVARVTGINPDWVNPIYFQYKECNFDLEVGIPQEAWVSNSSGASGYFINQGMAANAAAAAHNIAIEFTLGYFSELYGLNGANNLSLIDCSEVENLFIDAFNTNLPLQLQDQVVSYHNLNPFDDLVAGFSTTPEGFIGFDPVLDVDPVEFIGAPMYLNYFEMFRDDCTE